MWSIFSGLVRNYCRMLRNPIPQSDISAPVPCFCPKRSQIIYTFFGFGRHHIPICALPLFLHLSVCSTSHNHSPFVHIVPSFPNYPPLALSTRAIYGLYKMVIRPVPIHCSQFWALPGLLLFIALPNDFCIVPVNWPIAIYLFDAPLNLDF